MRQPAHAFAALIAERAAIVGKGVIVGDDHPALAGGDLLVGIKRENAGAAERSDRPRARKSAEALAAIFDENQLVLSRDLLNFAHSAWMSKRFHGDKRLRARRDA